MNKFWRVIGFTAWVLAHVVAFIAGCWLSVAAVLELGWPALPAILTGAATVVALSIVIDAVSGRFRK